MNPRTARTLRRLAVITGEKCRTVCNDGLETRCCSDAFCEFVAAGLRAVGREPPPATGHPTVPFMGPQGCIIPPEDRPGCSGYVCPEQLTKDRALRRKHRRLHERLNEDPDYRAMLNGARESMNPRKAAWRLSGMLRYE